MKKSDLYCGGLGRGSPYVKKNIRGGLIASFFFIFADMTRAEVYPSEAMGRNEEDRCEAGLTKFGTLAFEKSYDSK